jgi:hypothetical protein
MSEVAMYKIYELTNTRGEIERCHKAVLTQSGMPDCEVAVPIMTEEMRFCDTPYTVNVVEGGSVTRNARLILRGRGTLHGQGWEKVGDIVLTLIRG